MQSENEKLRNLLAEARGWVAPGSAVRARIDAALAEPVEGGSPKQTEWACYDCGSTGDFSTVQHPAGDYDVKCDGCGSTRTDEAGSVVRRLVLDLDTAQAERDEARAEVAAAYQRGAEAMREAAAGKAYTTLSLHPQPCRRSELREAIVEAIEALPMPEEK